ncbi:MAG: hypothetical protein H0V95_04790 [Actinobacteria bacterium]|nr:hypothetical protein [Actinomycetota bacterium]
MRRVATAVLVILVTASASAGTATAAPAGLRIAGASPLKLAGRDFKPHESVRVRVVSGTRSSTRRVRASRFTVTFQGFAYHPRGHRVWRPLCAA